MYAQLATHPMLPLLIASIAVMVVFFVMLLCVGTKPSAEVQAALDANDKWQAEHNKRVAHTQAMSAALDAGDIALYRELSNTKTTINAK